MSNNNDINTIFCNESKILETAKKIINHAQHKDHDLWPAYEEIVLNYEKLLKVTAKIFKISDIQSKILKKHESEIKRVNKNLSQMEEARRQLISDISHELGTPMTSIQGYIRAMLDRVIPPEDHYLDMIYEKTLLVNRLVEDLFELSKLESNQMKFNYQQVEVKEFLNNTTQKFGADIKEQGFHFSAETIINQPEGLNAILTIDPMRIEQVMNNLVFNAMKYTPAGGSIGIQAEIRLADKNDDHKMQGELIIKVIDNGPGIVESSLPYIFDRFYKVDRSQKSSGTGLGLAIAKQIILKHRGQIGVESQLMEGSSFYFSLPVLKI